MKLTFVLFIGLCATAAAADLPPCHSLMTARECGEHQALLASLRPGAALDHYLVEYARTRKEREAACNSAHSMDAILIGPRQRQALLQY